MQFSLTNTPIRDSCCRSSHLPLISGAPRDIVNQAAGIQGSARDELHAQHLQASTAQMVQPNMQFPPRAHSRISAHIAPCTRYIVPRGLQMCPCTCIHVVGASLAANGTPAYTAVQLRCSYLPRRVYDTSQRARQRDVEFLPGADFFACVLNSLASITKVAQALYISLTQRGRNLEACLERPRQTE